jgi:CopG family transcriptional regulator / antitoxin EndoAI
MSISTVNISFPTELLAKADRVAKREARSRSELVREALRIYVERQLRWEAIFGLGEEKQQAGGLTEADIAREIRAHRAAKRKRS